MTIKCTPEVMAQLQSLRTRYPWAVENRDQVVVAVFNYRAEARQFARRDPNNLTAFDASGAIWEVVGQPS